MSSPCHVSFTYPTIRYSDDLRDLTMKQVILRNRNSVRIRIPPLEKTRNFSRHLIAYGPGFDNGCDVCSSHVVGRHL